MNINKDAVTLNISYNGQTKTISGDFGISIVLKETGLGHLVNKSVVGMHDVSGAILLIQQLREMESEIRKLLSMPDEIIDQMLKQAGNSVSFSEPTKKPDQEMTPQELITLKLLKKLFGDDHSGF